ncbi:DUF3137 domain-containing protein [Mycoplasmopsis cynos]|uniref:DUF3137 domain-containing protein n=1 Tax=Mycoplasmopsis cynos TaxID=171284 RepID=A0A449AIL8_9BACT|nr:DUF3137 domain-containing protein [Mycoplasmopsis cynos]TQC54874.1 DUF3137 domain-containing protein [Mycoplasmopsis cynos]VEU64831.1 Uncharacterised protein [Mycoplasmopsis cynos]
MKVVSDYKKFDAYKLEVDEKLVPLFKEVIDEAFTKVNQTLLKRYQILMWSFYGFGVLMFLLGIGLFFNSFDYGLLIISLFGIISAIIGAIFNIKIYKVKKSVYNEINQNINDNLLYKKAFEMLEPKFKYLGKSENIITPREIKVYRWDVPAGAEIEKVSHEKSWIIDGKYPVGLVNVKWFQIIERSNNKEKEIRYYYSSLIKIDTRLLKEKGFSFTLFKSFSFWSNLQKIKLENSDFVKTFKVRSDDELKIRQMYTPLSMELSMQRYQDNKNSKVTKFHIYSTGEYIYYTFSSDMGFMELDIPFTLNKNKVVNKTYYDFMIDTYTFYYLLSIIYIPNYLD